MGKPQPVVNFKVMIISAFTTIIRFSFSALGTMADLMTIKKSSTDYLISQLNVLPYTILVWFKRAAFTMGFHYG